MLTVISDTHSTDDHQLSGQTYEAVQNAEMVAHAGDFMCESVLDALQREATQLVGVAGNNDDTGIRERLPTTRQFTFAGVQFVMTHTRRGGPTALSLLGRERDADVVIFGHSHRPTVIESEECTLVNPGSHAQPRGHRAAHAEFDPQPTGELNGRLITVDGDVFESFTITN
ncbi:metallophosphoesterase [Haloquadratum walsbyi]|jgi:putative phosphoesterase|uniref:Phosphoesterase n=1 Tax=Haloquadratum walsbyi (strain DSM 16854 / JCM 12705 / C23) TaxID=768065 RepID=G0LFL5_HALWC|nr:metallophosphoesterase [Haloquadratum walsbyi]CCC41778.1 MJ0936 family phosphodiesterase [Haloquadratum walsbyi C23]